MTWFNTIKTLTPEERRQTVDFLPEETKDTSSGIEVSPEARKVAWVRLNRLHTQMGKPPPTLNELEVELKNPIKLLMYVKKKERLE